MTTETPELKPCRCGGVGVPFCEALMANIRCDKCGFSISVVDHNGYNEVAVAWNARRASAEPAVAVNAEQALRAYGPIGWLTRGIRPNCDPLPVTFSEDHIGKLEISYEGGPANRLWWSEAFPVYAHPSQLASPSPSPVVSEEMVYAAITALRLDSNWYDRVEKALTASLSLAPAGEYKPVEIRNDEAGYVEFANTDVPYIVREIDGPVAILLDMETRNVIGYRVYDSVRAGEAGCQRCGGTGWTYPVLYRARDGLECLRSDQCPVCRPLPTGASAPHDRPAAEPGGMECMECGVIFVGAEWHTCCAVCSEKPRPVPAASSPSPDGLIERAEAVKAKLLGPSRKVPDRSGRLLRVTHDTEAAGVITDLAAALSRLRADLDAVKAAGDFHFSNYRLTEETLATARKELSAAEASNKVLSEALQQIERYDLGGRYEGDNPFWLIQRAMRNIATAALAGDRHG